MAKTPLLPVDFWYSPFGELLVAELEMIIAKEAVMGRKWRWMSGFQDEMFSFIDDFGFIARVSAPENEDEVRSGFIEIFNAVFSEGFPALAAMAAGFVGFDG